MPGSSVAAGKALPGGFDAVAVALDAARAIGIDARHGSIPGTTPAVHVGFSMARAVAHVEPWEVA